VHNKNEHQKHCCLRWLINITEWQDKIIILKQDEGELNRVLQVEETASVLDWAEVLAWLMNLNVSKIPTHNLNIFSIRPGRLK
jgi:hypothetical protein